jgi:hypothetical protein
MDDPVIVDVLVAGGGIVVGAILLSIFWRPFTRRSHDDLGRYASNDTVSETYDTGHHGHTHSDSGGHGGDGGGH